MQNIRGKIKRSERVVLRFGKPLCFEWKNYFSKKKLSLLSSTTSYNYAIWPEPFPTFGSKWYTSSFINAIIEYIFLLVNTVGVYLIIFLCIKLHYFNVGNFFFLHAFLLLFPNVFVSKCRAHLKVKYLFKSYFKNRVIKEKKSP